MILPIPEFILRLQHALTKPLPGIEAHKEMVPVGRVAYEKIQNQVPEYRKSAVLIHLCLEETAGWKLIFIQRNAYDGVHSAQMAFPGGKYDELDGNLRNTAIREAFEEVQLQRHHINMIGQLSELHIPVSGFTVSPFVSWQHGLPNLIADEAEVRQIFMLPLSSFYDERNRTETEVTISNGSKKIVQAFEIEGQIIWGATAMMMHEFVTITKVI